MTTPGRSLLALLVVVGLGLVTPGVSGRQQPSRQQPPFRATTNLVRVDAYPTKDGRIIRGLTVADFEILEDGVPQKIESFEYVEYEQNSPVESRRDPNSQRDGFQLAADPTYRVFVVYLDNLHVDFKGSHSARVPLITFLNQVLGPRDLFGVLTTAQDVKDLMLGQQTLFIEEQLTKYWDWGRGARVVDDDEDMMIRSCFQRDDVVEALTRRRRMDEVFTDLDSLVAKLGELREERKNILLVSNGWELPGRAPSLRAAVPPRPPSIGVTNAGKLTMGRTDPTTFDPRVCEDFLQRLSDMDFQQRQRDLLRAAREANVTFYAIKPNGLVAPLSVVNGRTVLNDRSQVDSLLTLSNNTDGLAIVNTNNLTDGARQIAQDLSAVYLLGYSPTNTKPDGRVRRITVKLRPGGDTVRARREYRAPSAEEIAALRTAAAAPPPPSMAAPVEAAFGELKRLRPGAILHTRATILESWLVITTELTAPEVEAGRWREGGDIQVMVSDTGSGAPASGRGRLEPGQRSSVVRVPVGEGGGAFSVSIRLRSTTQGNADDSLTVTRGQGVFGSPLIYRGQTPATMRPAGSPQFRRTERLKVEWPLLKDSGAVTARLLGRDGVPLDLAVEVMLGGEISTDGPSRKHVITELNLAPLTAGEYALQISGTGQDSVAYLAFRVTR